MAATATPPIAMTRARRATANDGEMPRSRAPIPANMTQSPFGSSFVDVMVSS